MSETLDGLRPWLGRTVTYTAPEPIGAAAFRYFAIAIGDDNPLYRDRDAARAAGYRDVIAPPTLICETNQYLHGRPDSEGYLGHQWGFPVPQGSRQIRGGNSYELFQPVHPDDVITATWRVADITEKPSSKGGTMVIILSEVAFTNQLGEALATNTDTMIWMVPE